MGKNIKKRPKPKKSYEERAERSRWKKSCWNCHRDDVTVGKDGLCPHCRRNLT